MGESLEATGDSADNAANKAKALSNAIKNLGQEYLDPLDAQVAFNDAVSQSATAAKEGAKGFDLTTDAGRKSYAALKDVADASRDWSAAIYDSTGSMVAAQGPLTEGRKKFLALADSLGVPKDRAKALADQLFDISKIDPTVKTDGINAAKVSFDNLGNTIVEVDGRKVTIPVGTVNVPQVIDLLTTVKGAALNADGTQVVIPTSSPTAPFTKLLLNNINGAAVSADGKSVTVPTEAADAVSTYRKLLNLSGAALSADAKRVNIPVSAPLSDTVKQKLKTLEGVTVSADGKSVNVSVSAPNAPEVIGQIRTIMNQPSSKKITVGIGVYTTNYQKTVQQGGGGADGNPLTTRAQGGVTGRGGVRMLAYGDVLTRQPMIAPGGSNILWAEDETHGESYIPHAMDRRERATKILAKTADIFGYKIIPAADGWMSTGPARSQVPGAVTLRPVIKVDGSARLHPDDLKALVASIRSDHAALSGAIERGLSGREMRQGQRANIAIKVGGRNG